MGARRPHMYCLPSQHPCLCNFIDHLYALSCPLGSCSVLPPLCASDCCPFCKFLLSGSAGDATPSPVSQIMHFIYSHLTFTGSVRGQKEKPFYKNINANLISTPPLPATILRLSRQRGHKDRAGDNQLI